jgi:hypothetical protein
MNLCGANNVQTLAQLPPSKNAPNELILEYKVQNSQKYQNIMGSKAYNNEKGNNNGSIQPATLRQNVHPNRLMRQLVAAQKAAMIANIVNVLSSM